MMTLQLLQVVILVLILTQTVNSFFVKSSRHCMREISMGGGRSKGNKLIISSTSTITNKLKLIKFIIIIILILYLIAEQGLTNKQVFQTLKTKFNEKAKIPGFFEVGEHVVCLKILFSTIFFFLIIIIIIIIIILL